MSIRDGDQYEPPQRVPISQLVGVDRELYALTKDGRVWLAVTGQDERGMRSIEGWREQSLPEAFARSE